MFYNKKLYKNKAHNNLVSLMPVNAGVPSVISHNLQVLGNLVSEGAIEVQGKIEGNITCAHATIHKSGFIKGDVIADVVHINGEVRGLIKARYVQLSENGRVVGVIMYENLSIEPGGFVDGQCKNTEKMNKTADIDQYSLADEDEIKLIDDAE
ncbi:MAG: polymer-forming cytoskeletal protein [Pseudomonadota bacterium]